MSDMTELAERLKNFTGSAEWRAIPGGMTMKASTLDPISMAQSMLSASARLITMTGVVRDDGETDILYHYELENFTFTIETSTHGQAITSIAGITHAADWIEREIHDLYAVNFIGHPDLSRLIRPAQLEDGFFRTSGPTKQAINKL